MSLLVEAPFEKAGGLEVKRHGDDFVAHSPHHKISIEVSRLRESPSGLTGEVTIEHAIAGLLHFGTCNLLSLTARESLIRKLRRITGQGDDRSGPNWDALVERLCVRITKDFRAGSPLVPLLPKPARMTRELVEKLLPLGQTTVGHGDGDSGKSFLALAVALAVATGLKLPGGLHPTQSAPVMYLDYESTQEDHEERLYTLVRGLGVDYQGGIFYRAMRDRDVAEEAPSLRVEISRLGIGLVVVDSLGPASLRDGGEPWHASAIRTFNALSTFAPATRLVIAHQARDDVDRRSGPGRAFGGVFIRNLARSEWEIRRTDEDEETGHLTLALYHRKNNRGRRYPPIGLRFEFADDAVRLRSYDLADEPSLLGRTSLTYRIQQILRDGAQDVDAIAETSQAKPDAVRQALNRLRGKGKVIRLEDVVPGKAGRWGLAAPEGRAS